MIYQNRLALLQKLIKNNQCDALLVEDPTNLYYLTGCDLSTGRCLINQKGAFLLVDARYFEVCSKKSPFPVLPLETYDWPILLNLPEFQSIKTLGFDAEQTTYQKFIDLQKSLHHHVELIPLKNPVQSLRKIKTPDEIALLRQAAELGSKGFDYICTLLKEGIREVEVARELEIFWKKQGGNGVAFEPIIAFGANSSMPHYRAGEIQLKKGHIVLIDIGVNFKHYHSDMTRTLFFGEPEPKLLEIFSIVKEAHQAALLACKPGLSIGELDDVARLLIKNKGYGDQFSHSLGHGLGLEVHEQPLIRNKPPYNHTKLEAGMVITIEPGIYLSGIGGVRLEDTIVITEDGYENLTNRGHTMFCSPK